MILTFHSGNPILPWVVGVEHVFFNRQKPTPPRRMVQTMAANLGQWPGAMFTILYKMFVVHTKGANNKSEGAFTQPGRGG